MFLSIVEEWIDHLWYMSHYSSEHECTVGESSKHNVEQKTVIKYMWYDSINA